MSTESGFFRRWPEDASTDYIKARRELLEAETALDQQVRRVAELRRSLPPGAAAKNYTFEDASIGAALDGRKITLDELVGDRSLFVKHMMLSDGEADACPSCSMWIDGYNGVAQHFAQHADFVVVAPGPPAAIQAYAQRRGWTGVRLLSSRSDSFDTDLNLAHPDWAPQIRQAPGVSVFKRDGDVVRHLYTATPDFVPGQTGGMDLLSPVWAMLDLIPEGRGDWNPSNKYVKEAVAA